MANVITSTDPNVTIQGTSLEDWITSTGDGATIYGGGNNDYIISRGSAAFVDGGNDNDTILAYRSSGGLAPAQGGGITTIRGQSGEDWIIIGRDTVTANGGNGNDLMLVQLYESDGNISSSLSSVTLTGGEGRDTFAFNSSLPSYFEAATSVSGPNIQVLITDFSSSDCFFCDTLTDEFKYTMVTDPLTKANTDVILTSDSGRITVTLKGVTDIEDVVYATAGHFVNDSISTTTFGEMISNYDEDTSALPTGLSYENFTVHVSSYFGGNVFLQGRDVIKNVSTYKNLLARTIDARSDTRSRILAGNNNANVIYAGSGGNSLWGASSSADTMYGGSKRDMFWYGEGDGTDCIRNFAFGSSDTSDIINFYTGDPQYAYRQNNTVHIGTVTGEEVVMPTSYVVDSVIQYSTDANNISRAKIGEQNTGNTFTYDSNVNVFVGGSAGNTLTVSDSKTNMIYLGGGYGQSYSNIQVLDASNSHGSNHLAGDSQNNSILGGYGNSSLWGGSSSSANDTLIGGSGSEMFWYGKNEGNDVIVGASSNDTINLYDTALSDITEASVSGNTCLIKTTTGHSLTLTGMSNSPVFKLSSSGSGAWTYTSNHWAPHSY